MWCRQFVVVESFSNLFSNLFFFFFVNNGFVTFHFSLAPLWLNDTTDLPFVPPYTITKALPIGLLG